MTDTPTLETSNKIDQLVKVIEQEIEKMDPKLIEFVDFGLVEGGYNRQIPLEQMFSSKGWSCGLLVRNHWAYCFKLPLKQGETRLWKIGIYNSLACSDEEPREVKYTLSFEGNFLFPFIQGVKVENLYCLAYRKLAHYQNHTTPKETIDKFLKSFEG